MSERWIIVRGWEGFQHRDAARSVVPTWIKVYTDLMGKDEFLDLSFHLRGVLVSVWLEYATGKRQLSDNSVRLSRRLGQKVTRRDLDRLCQAGFLELSASKPARNIASTDASLEEKREEESSRESLTSTTDPARGNGWVDNLGAYTGCRYVRGTHAITAVHDVLGTERPPNDWPYERPTRKEILAALEEQAHA